MKSGRKNKYNNNQVTSNGILSANIFSNLPLVDESKMSSDSEMENNDFDEQLDDAISMARSRILQETRVTRSKDKTEMTELICEAIGPMLKAAICTLHGSKDSAKAECKKVVEENNVLMRSVMINQMYERDNLEQTSKEKNLRVLGIKVTTDSTDRLTPLLKYAEDNGVELTPADVDEVFDTKTKDTSGGTFLLVKFTTIRAKKTFESIKFKQLRKSKTDRDGVFICDDLTRLRMKMLNYVKGLDQTSKVHTFNGAIQCTVKRGREEKRHVIRSPDDLFGLGVDDVPLLELGVPKVIIGMCKGDVTE